MASSKYQKYTPLEHILARPGMYIGSVEFDSSKQWIIEENQFVEKNVLFSPGLYKIFDEILVNAIDQSTMDTELDKIAVNVNKEEGFVSVLNTGNGIPIEMHETHKVYIPELIFGNLLTSSNYDDTQQRTTGGTNGLGAKLTNVFSTHFIVETVNEGKKYIQEWKNNMSEKSKPKITKCNKKGYVKITFYPDFEKFKMKSFQDTNIVELFEKRTYDACACTHEKVKVYFNDKQINVKTFEKYTQLYLPDKTPKLMFYANNWEICVAPTTKDSFRQVSFVNGINTSIGGSHVDCVMGQLIKKITETLTSKHKDLKVKPQYIKDHMFVFIKCLIVNPSFSSQLKTECTTRYKDFGSRLEITDDQIKKVLKLGFIEDIIALAKHKENRELNKTDGKKSSSIRGIPKLEDAVKAGTSQSNKCTLILTEGDSAKTFAISGLSIVGRDYYGVFPLKGKLLNVREATTKQLMDNTEINNIKQILGLQQGKVYKNTDDLRYGHVMILTDADVDGSHIKGLFINFIHTFWSSLLQNIPDFLVSMRTPIIKASLRQSVKEFYTQIDFERWYKNTPMVKQWKIKYYKGLGTSTSNEAKEYFKQLERNVVKYTYDKTDNSSVVLAFQKNKSDERKTWITQGTEKNETLDSSTNNVSVNDFIHKDLIWFSIHDNVRSIPNIMDGLKPSQRKILYVCRKRNITNEIKVSQLSGIVSSEAAYHHGEVSLMSTIINMAQNFVGSNTMNLLEPIGQFGTRLLGGKDAASPRYIFTKLSEHVKYLFNSNDDPILTYLEDDGMKIEPQYYVPILPLVLINGAEGIGTGYSTNIPCFNPDDIKQNIICYLNSKEMKEMVPWYPNFKGSIHDKGNGSYVTKGVWKLSENKKAIKITELPIGKWTNVYKEFLDSLLDKNIIKKYENHSSESDVHFIVHSTSEFTDDTDAIESILKLTSSLSTTNMHLFNEKGIITKYNDVNYIIKNFVDIRLKYYNIRKEYLLHTWSEQLNTLGDKIRFIKLVINEDIIVFRRNKQNIKEQLENHEFSSKQFDELLSIKLHAFTEEELVKLENEITKIKTNMNVLKQKSKHDLFIDELI